MSRPPTYLLAGAGAVVLRRDTGEVLLIRRAKPPSAGGWRLPGGDIEAGETVRAAAAREAREETGLDVDIGPLVGGVDEIGFDEGGAVEDHYLLCKFFAIAAVDSDAAIAGDDAVAIRRVRSEEIAAVPGILAKVADVVAKAYALSRAEY